MFLHLGGRMIQLGALLIEQQCEGQSSSMWVQPNWLKFASKLTAARNFEEFSWITEGMGWQSVGLSYSSLTKKNI